MKSLEKYFSKFRNNVIGIDHEYETPYGVKKIIYNDWIASGRLYGPLEDKIIKTFGPYVANTHTETSETGTIMTWAYHYARDIIKKHVHAGPDDVLLFGGYGMTGVINKLQRILGLKVNPALFDESCLKKKDRPVVFVTHMEHHSNHTSWYETIADVVILKPNSDLLVDLDELRRQLFKYKNRKLKIGAFTAASNVTGVKTPYYELAKIMHENGGLCFIDFAASAPYADINMHPKDPQMKLDAIYFSPHKFLGGPGASGVVVFDSKLYHNPAPDHPGGGTVAWTNRWGEYEYIDDIELREDGGTPGFLQAIRAALAIELKEQMSTEKIKKREDELIELALSGLEAIPELNILADNVRDRLGVISFYHKKIHFNLIVKILSDRFGIQIRGGCVCAGTYGHFLLNVSQKQSEAIVKKIEQGDMSEKPGWVRWSLHPVTTDAEVRYFIKALNEIIQNADDWSKEYYYDKRTNEYYHRTDDGSKMEEVENWFKF
jgi:selenocysteine lyase/cysteine desulfurase